MATLLGGGHQQRLLTRLCIHNHQPRSVARRFTQSATSPGPHALTLGHRTPPHEVADQHLAARCRTVSIIGPTRASACLLSATLTAAGMSVVVGALLWLLVWPFCRREARGAPAAVGGGAEPESHAPATAAFVSTEHSASDAGQVDAGGAQTAPLSCSSTSWHPGGQHARLPGLP